MWDNFPLSVLQCVWDVYVYHGPILLMWNPVYGFLFCSEILWEALRGYVWSRKTCDRYHRIINVVRAKLGVKLQIKISRSPPPAKNKNCFTHTVPKESNFPRYNMKCSRKNVIIRRLFLVVSCFPLHFMLYRGNLDYFSDSAGTPLHTAVKNDQLFKLNTPKIG